MSEIINIFTNPKNNIEYNKEDIEYLLKIAYKKLKSEIYFDTSNLFMRKKIAQFEKYNNESDNFNLRIKSLAIKIMNDELDNHVDNIGYNCLPKSVIVEEKEEENHIKNYINHGIYNLNKITYFIDIDVESHIMGVLWVLLFGKKLEKLYGNNTYGNRLANSIYNNDINLFKPYFNEYEKWKNNGITSVEKMIDLKKKSFMISLDIQDYYYSTNVSFNRLKEDLELDDFDNIKKVKGKINKARIEMIVFKFINIIFERYNKKLIDDKIIKSNKMEEKYNNLIIPIGFTPSKIISNWYLKELDNEIIDKINPMYYGRYIDDILIVIPKYNKNMQNYKHILNDYFCNNNIFTYALYNNHNNIVILNKKDNIENLKLIIEFIPREDLKLKSYIKEKFKQISSEFEIDIFEDWNSKTIKEYLDLFYIDLRKNDEFEDIYKEIIIELKFNNNNSKKIYIANKYIQNNCLKNIVIQEAKIRVFEFKHNGSRALLDAFKLELKKNASIFRFLPEKTEVLKGFDREAFKIDYLDNINKLSDVKGFDISKYKLSKFLARIIYSDKLENDSYTKTLDQKILWAFKDDRCIEYYTLWEKVLVYYVINSRYKKVYEFIQNILKSIDNMDIKIDDFQMYYPKDLQEDKIIHIVRDSLIKHLEIAISMVYALDDGLFKEYKESYSNKDQVIDELHVMSYLTQNMDLKNIDTNNFFRTIKEDKNNLRLSNMIRHDLVREVLLNYTNLISNREMNNEKLNLIEKKVDIKNTESRYRCTIINKSYEQRKNRIEEDRKENCEESCKYSISKDCNISCKYKLSDHAKNYSPRFVNLHELIIYEINYRMSRGEIISGNRYITDAMDKFTDINGIYFSEGYRKRILTSVDEIRFQNLNYYNIDDYLFTQKQAKINIFNLESYIDSKRLKIGIVNMRVNESDIVDSFNKVPNLSDKRLERINSLLNSAVKNGAEMIIFPEVSIPYQWLGPISNFAKNNDVAIVCGLEHIVYENKLCCNYLATILPERYESYNYAIIKLRLKNTYSPKEKQWVNGYNWRVPTMIGKNVVEENKEQFIKEYDLFRWRGVDFSAYSCFELANIKDRALFGSYVDLLIGSVHNKDTNYYSNIIESLSRDIHCYFVQVNNSEIGDNRIISPSSTVSKNIVQVTGGLNDVVLVGEIDIEALRAHQQLDHSLQIENSDFKPSPPEFNYENVRVRNKLPL